ncbi:MAG: threonyl-tRNA synthetase editing domain-containing protein, partial [Thermoplasmata archaeon]
MRILFIHADHFEYEATEKTKYAEEATAEELKGSFGDSLVCFISAEKRDEADSAAIARKAADEIEDVATHLKETRVVLYPYAHLSSSLARPEKAREIFERLEEAVRERDLEVHRSPFGWYKAFNIAAKGHPLSELSREVTLEEAEAPPAEEKPHAFLVLTLGGEELEPENYTSGREAFDVMVRKEALKEEYPSTGEPGYHRLTRKFGFKWESLSDIGHMRYDPKAS